MPLFQSESKCETFHVKMGLLHAVASTRFETEARETRKWPIDAVVPSFFVDVEAS